MLPTHAECSGCCARNLCHFCLRPARHAAEDGANTFRCCDAHLPWLYQVPVVQQVQSTRAPRVFETPVPDLPVHLR